MSIYPTFKTPSLNDPKVVALAKTINSGKLKKIPLHKNLLPLGNCYWNVEYMVNNYGGSIQYGWIFNTWDKVLIDAMHHAVWRTKDGLLVDVTEGYPSLSNTHIIFLPDNLSALKTLDIVPAIHNHRKILTNHKHIKNYVAAYTNKIDLVGNLNKLFYGIGYRCENNRAKASGKPQSPLAAPQGVVEEINFYTNSIQHVDQHLGAYIDFLNQLSSGQVK